VVKLDALDEQARNSFEKALAALETGDRDDALEAIESKEAINMLAQETTTHLLKRLVADEPDRLEAFGVESDIIESYRRINTYSRWIARLCLAMEPEKKADS
jgi:phosphate:Na+ symporter